MDVHGTILESYVRRYGEDVRILDDSPSKVIVAGKPGHGGSCRSYLIPVSESCVGIVEFQKGPVQKCGANGCQNEDLLAIVIDRLEGFQSGDYACGENRRALLAVKQALGWLDYRTEDRRMRGVEGTSKP